LSALAMPAGSFKSIIAMHILLDDTTNLLFTIGLRVIFYKRKMVPHNGNSYRKISKPTIDAHYKNGR
jgi:hypothetical protein